MQVIEEDKSEMSKNESPSGRVARVNLKINPIKIQNSRQPTLRFHDNKSADQKKSVKSDENARGRVMTPKSNLRPHPKIELSNSQDSGSKLPPPKKSIS